MRRALLGAFAVVAVTLVTVGAGAASSGDSGTSNLARFAKIDLSLLEANGPHGKFVPASLSNEPVSAVLELGTAPVAVQDATAKQHGKGLSQSAKASIRASIKAQQDALSSGIANAGATVVGQMQDAYNGIQVTVPQKNIGQLAALPGVTAVHAVPTFRPANVNGVPFIGGTASWDSGFTGQGVDIAIIDTGIDYTHADFGGPGTVAAWDNAKAHSTDPPDPTLVGPTAPKVKKGFDFVGDDYDASSKDPAKTVPHADPNPLDCNDHGTHTAGTLAGFGVRADGSTYHGPYNSTVVTPHDPNGDWKVGPGVAPQANLFVYRVFGCNGSSQIVDLAINRAVQDGAQVISMSLGSDFGGTQDPTSVASQNAVDDGIAVVAAAGNAGNNAYMVGSPSTANGVISAAAIDGSNPQNPGATLALSTGKSVDALDANGAPLPTGSLPVKVLKNPDGSISLGCDKSEYAGTAGDLVVTARGTCARVARAVFGDEAGAAAVVMVNSSDTFPPFEGQITGDPDTGEQHTVTIPFLGVKSSDGPTLLAADGGTVTLSPLEVTNTTYQHAADFSSGGPRNFDSAPKPDVIAPGVSVISAGMGTGTGPLIDSGTSMATPMTAGTAALVKQAHPDWNALQIKAAIMNTADPSLNIGYNSRLAGTGVVQAQRATNSSVLAQTSDQLDALAFGYQEGTADFSSAKTFTLTNTGTSAETYDLAAAGNGSQHGSSIAVSPTTVTVPAGGSSTVTVTLSVSSAAFAALPSDDTDGTPGAVTNVRGDIVATPASGDDASAQPLSVPYMLVPRGLSNVTAGAPSAFQPAVGTTPGKGQKTPPGNTFSATLPVTNSGIHAGTADLYAWGITDPKEGGDTMDVRDVGVQSLPGSAFGVSDSDRGLVFLINTWSHASNQALNEYDVDIDTNGDGQPDFVVAGADLGAVTTGTFDGIMASFTINVATGDIVDAFLADAPMNGSTIELPALASDLGLAQTNNGNGSKGTQFAYAVAAFSDLNGNVDTTSSATFDPFNPAVSSGAFASLDPGASDSLPLTVNADQLKKTQALGWLVASVDDADGAAQAEEVKAPTGLR